MGSIEKACISGFLCRLCSEMHRTVIHIYSDHGQRLCLVEKINGYLPITISPTDPLPKTICKSCLHRVEQHYSLLMRLTRMREERKFKLIKYKAQRNPSISSVESEEDVINSSSVHECPNRNEEDQATPRSESTSTAAETRPQTQESQTPKSRKTAVSTRKRSERHDASGAGPSNRHRKKETGTGNSEKVEGTHAD
ncbi:uncharacterized protein LOC6619639 [Drosophila sechellia]|uniref:GM17760 n=1 Tax=Drosophila sechellia TaxID=7238 RepID=B4IJE4_DROSE|nr:uncharacterized protein LOC6619639 [Drosophila sechellia]EDW51135.1 GM17760 [Drosophila sechellia]